MAAVIYLIGMIHHAVMTQRTYCSCRDEVGISQNVDIYGHVLNLSMKEHALWE